METKDSFLFSLLFLSDPDVPWIYKESELFSFVLVWPPPEKKIHKSKNCKTVAKYCSDN